MSGYDASTLAYPDFKMSEKTPHLALGQNIRRLRQDKGWSQGKLSELTGIKMGHISTLEKGEGNPTVATLYKLIDALECSADALLMDVTRASPDALLKQTLERALRLPDIKKAAIMEVVDGYCRAHGLEAAFEPGNNGWIRFFMTERERLPTPTTTIHEG